jgi:DNA-binding YbaB/EbfC family protein
MTKGFGNILKQAQEIHAKISQLQEEMAGKTVEAGSGGGMVNVVMNGKQEVLSIRIDPEVVNREDIEMLQDLMEEWNNGKPQKAFVPNVPTFHYSNRNF